MPTTANFIFNRKSLKSELDRFSLPETNILKPKRDLLKKWQEAIDSQALRNIGEVELHGSFLNDIFGKVLNYETVIDSPTTWSLRPEQKTNTDATRADAALGYFSKNETDIRVVIELKDALTNLDAKQHRKNDNRTPVEQAFSYAHKSGKNCKWVIVSNYIELRLYHFSSSGEYEHFKIAELVDENEFNRFYFLLSKENLTKKDANSKIEAFFERNEAEEEKISKEFYLKYKQARSHLFVHIRDRNPGLDEIPILEKTQKILDRFIFICFCEDRGLLPERIFRKVVNQAKESFSVDENKIWPSLKGLFRALDIGAPNRDINAFNGGLFAEDSILDSLIIDDEIFDELVKITDYDFESELNVDILGHIFEQSISDLEEFRAELIDEIPDKKSGKRKKEGVYYTPDYITRYIVENTIGPWLEDRKRELGIDNLPELTDKDYESVFTKKGKLKNKKIEKHLIFWESYKEKLRNIKVLDPACGSGAFLVQAFDYLHRDGEVVNRTIGDFKGGLIDIEELDKEILSNNLYGVDLNTESVEITKLSLWIKTANKYSQLTILKDNIRCGNSLISDPNLVGAKAFNWDNEFSDIMRNGGFDIVIGNPPYVRQELLSPYKSYLSENYKIYTGTTDLFSYFYEKGLNLLKSNCYFGFISNSFAKTAGAGVLLRKYLKNNSRIISIIDFSDMQIFPGATTYPIIPILKKEKTKSEFQYLKVRSDDLQILESSKLTKSFLIQQSSLKDEYWTFEAEKETNLKTKIRRFPSVKEQIGKCYYGIKTGLNEAFIISKEVKDRILTENPNESKLFKPYLEGKDLNKWYCTDKEKWLIFIPWHFPLHNDESIKGASIEAEALFKKSYPGTYKYLAGFKGSLINRNKSETGIRYEWFALQRCAASYFKEFEKPKIIWPNLQSSNKFSLDTDRFYINAPCVILPTNNKALLCIVNSKLAWFFFKDICVVRSGGYIEMKPQYFEQLPVVLPKDEQPFIEKAERVIINSEERQNTVNNFFELIVDEFKISKKTKKLSSWFQLSWQDFIAELKKAKVNLSPSDKLAWKKVFKSEQKKVTDLNSLILNIEREIDILVYDLYGLSEEEINIIEQVI